MPARGTLRALIVSVIATVAVVGGSGPAGAQISDNCNPNGPECISIESAQGLHQRTFITVDGSGFTPGVQVVLDENGSIPGGDVIFNRRGDITVTVDPDGAFHVIDVVDRRFVGRCAGGACQDGNRGLVRRVDCAIDQCFLQVEGGSDVFGTDLFGIWSP